MSELAIFGGPKAKPTSYNQSNRYGQEERTLLKEVIDSGRLMGPGGKVLPVRPVKFHPPGAYTEKLGVKIGVRENAEHYGQYVEIHNTPRKLHGAEQQDSP